MAFWIPLIMAGASMAQQKTQQENAKRNKLMLPDLDNNGAFYTDTNSKSNNYVQWASLFQSIFSKGGGA